MSANAGATTYGVTADGAYWLQVGAYKDLRLLTERLAQNQIPTMAESRFSQDGLIKFIAASDADTVATVSLTELCRWQKGKDKPVWEIKLDQIDVTGVVVSPGGKLIAVTGDAGQVRILTR